MKNKLILTIVAVVVVLLLTFAYQAINEKKAPELTEFVSGITCKKQGNTIVITSEKNTQAVVTFSSDGTKVIGFMFYQKPIQIGSRSVGSDLLAFIDKYKDLINFAKECFLDTATAK